MSRERAALLLSQLCNAKLRAVGAPAHVVISAQEVSDFLQGEGKGVVGLSESTIASTRQGPKGIESTSISMPLVNEEVNKTVADKSEALAKELRRNIQTVWECWVILRRSNSDTAISLIPDEKSAGKIADRLAYGFTPEQLCDCLTRVIGNPALVKRTKVLAISKPLESDQRVCSVLGIPYKAPERVTWLTPFDQAWKEQYGVSGMNFGAFAKVATRLLAKHNAEAVLEEFEAYIQRTALDYVSWPKFESGFGAWATAPRGNQRGRDAHESASMVKGIF